MGGPWLGVGEDDPVDVAVRLEVNHWNGAVEPQVVLGEVYPRDAEEKVLVAAASGGSASKQSWRGIQRCRGPRSGPLPAIFSVRSASAPTRPRR